MRLKDENKETIIRQQAIKMIVEKGFDGLSMQKLALRENYWGKGIGTEVCKALVKHCFENSENKDIVALTDLDNIGSQKVLLNSGFERMENFFRDNREVAYFILKNKS